MNTNKTKLFSFLLFIVFFFVGLQFGFSPFSKSIKNVKESGELLTHNASLGSTLQPPPNYISENQYKIDIINYDLNIDLFPEKKMLEGDATLTGILLDKNLTEIHLNFYDNLKISNILLNDKESLFYNEGTRLTIPLNKFESDTFKVNIKYSGTPKRAGLAAFVFGEINSRSVVYNLNEPNYASTWFPCNDYPEDKAILNIKITNDSSQTSVSNGVLAGVMNNRERKTYHWKTIYPISTYLICIYSSEYENFSDQYISLDEKDTMNIEYYVFPDHLSDAKKDFSIHPDVMKFFAEKFGEYPFIKEKYGVAEFLWQMGAMEHQTISGIGSNFINGRRFYDDIYVHELAHHWWGNAIGPATWKDIWLNEGFATYSEVLYSEHIAGKKALQSNMLSKFQDFTGKLYDPGNYLFSQTIYDKGAWVLHMLRFEIGDSSFFKTLREYFERYKYKNASSKDFQKLAEEISGKNLDKFFDQWLYSGVGIINLNYLWNFEKNNTKDYHINIEFNQTQNGYKEYNFPLQVMVEYSDESHSVETIYLDKRQKNIAIKAGKKPKNIILDPDNWLLANISEKSKEE